jgi:DNA polymerase V
MPAEPFEPPGLLALGEAAAGQRRRADCRLVLVDGHVRAGFPSPAEDFNTKRVDLTELLITHPQATFLLRASGDSMREAGIHDKDLLIVNRALPPLSGCIVIAVVDGEFTVKYLRMRAGHVRLVAANPTYPDIVPRDGQTLEIWGVVTDAIKHFAQPTHVRAGRRQ